MDTKTQIKEFYNKLYGFNDPLELREEEFKVENNYEGYMETYVKDAKRVLDYGCGITYNIYLCHYLNKDLELLLGIDPSKNAITFLEDTARKSKLDNVHFKVGELNELEKIEDNYFGLIINANNLDCIEPTEAKITANELVRVLAKDGTLILKVNFFLNEEAAKANKLVPLGDGQYSSNGIYRINFKQNEYWINMFKDLGLTLIKEDEFARLERGPKDRIFIFKK